MPLGKELARVTTLQLYLRKMDDCERAGILIDRAPGIKRLAIEFEHCPFGFKIFGRRSAPHLIELGRDVVQKLFQSVNSTTHRTDLESLRIKSIPLDEFLLVLPTKLPLRNLKHLQLNRCRGVGPFIAMLAQLGVDLSSYHIIFRREAYEVRESNEALIHSMSSPKRVSMSSTGEMLCDWAVVTSRAPSLLSFVIDDVAYDDDVQNPVGTSHTFLNSMAGFFGFCSAASSLEQLAVLSPPIESEHWKDEAGLDRFLVSVSMAIHGHTN
jgi:hypothetical protein